jgi:serine/threonine protein kinase
VQGISLVHHPNVTEGLLSPIMLGTLFELPFSITKHIIDAVYKALSTALSKLHALNIIHCDIKPHNIFRDGEGRYHLADYDSCVCEQAIVEQSTRSFWPADLINSGSCNLLASKSLDYAMLAATLFFLADYWNVLDGHQMPISEMTSLAQKMKLRKETGADEIIECLAKIT